MVAQLRRTPVVFVFALVAYLSLFRGAFDHIADDPGLGWHLANGAVIAETRVIPRTDPFLAPPVVSNPYAAVGEPRPWINEQWLSDLVFFELFAAGGWPLIYGVIAGLYLIAYFGVAADSLRRSGEGWLVVLVGVVVAFKLGQVHLIVRPVLFSIVLFSVLVARCRSLVTEGEWSWRDLARESLILGGVIALWANIHPGFVYGLAVLGLVIVSVLVNGPARWARGSKATAIFAVCVIASSFNPFGFGLYDSIYHLGGSSALRAVTTEWSPINLQGTEGTLLLVMILIPCVCALTSCRIRRGVGLFEVLLAVSFALQAMWAIRVVPFASLACLPLWAACFGGKNLLPEGNGTRLTRTVLRHVGERDFALTAPGMRSASLIALCGLVAMVIFPSRVLPQRLGSAYERRLSEMFPTHEASPKGVILASPDWGGSITHLFWPRSKTALDDRTVVVGEGLYRAYGESLRNPHTFDQLVRIFGVTDVLAPSSSNLLNHLGATEQWQRVSESGDTIHFRKR